eukprot:92460-Prorocentrum_minimum.AAC.1
MTWSSCRTRLSAKSQTYALVPTGIPGARGCAGAGVCAHVQARGCRHGAVQVRGCVRMCRHGAAGAG